MVAAVTATPEPLGPPQTTREGRRATVAWMLALAVLVVLVAVLSGHLHLGLLPQQFQSETITGDTLSGGWRGVRFRDAAGREVAVAAISTTALTPGLSLLYVHFTHREDLSVSDLSLRFSYGSFHPRLALDQSQLPGWPSAQWTAEDAGVQRASLENLRTLGGGSIFLEFYVGLGPHSQLAMANPTLEVEANITSGGLMGSFVNSQATGSIPLFTPQDLAAAP